MRNEKTCKIYSYIRAFAQQYLKLSTMGEARSETAPISGPHRVVSRTLLKMLLCKLLRNNCATVTGRRVRAPIISQACTPHASTAEKSAPGAPALGSALSPFGTKKVSSKSARLNSTPLAPSHHLKGCTEHPLVGRGFRRAEFHATASVNQRDYYDILGVPRNASKKDIKKAYYQLAKKMHPDLNRDDPKATEKFAEVQSAYEILSDEEKRAGYDQFGFAGADGNPFGGGGAGGAGNPFGGQRPEDIFRGFQDIFGQQRGGGAGQQMRNAPQRGGDVQAQLRLSFMEAVNGCKKDVTFRQAVTCKTCDGSGAKPGTKPSVCGRCNGTGAIHVSRGFFQMQMPCDQCHGEGTIIADPCGSCRGEGRITKLKTLQVTIPKGVDTGINMRLSSQGDEGMRGGGAGSLYVEIEVERDVYFERDGADVHTDLSIRLSQAALGGTVPLKTLRGDVDLKVKAGTQPGEQVVLRGRGINRLNGGERGNHYVHFHVDVPSSLTDRQRALLEELDKTLDPDYDSEAEKEEFDENGAWDSKGEDSDTGDEELEDKAEDESIFGKAKKMFS